MKQLARLITVILFQVYLSTGLSAQEIDIPASSKSRGMSAYPFPVKVEQPDGEVIQIRNMGDRMLHLFETTDGYAVLKNKEGYYVYATLDGAQNLVPSDQPVGFSKGAPAGIQKNLRYSKQQVDAAKKAYFTDNQVKSSQTPFPGSGTNNVLVILAEFQDRPSSLPPASIENMMAAPDYNGTGSFRDYYLEVSYNNLSLEPTVVPWVRVSQNMTYYGGNDELGYDLRPHELIREALDLVEAGGFDFSPFDNDNDGYVDEIIVIHAGYGEQYVGTGDTTIWSHSFHLEDLAVEYDGVILDNYIVAPELYGSTGTQLNSIGTLTREFAHSLGMPDIYDVDLEGTGGYAFDPNFWDLMAEGSWNNEGNTPAGINAWLKRYMGWLNIPTIDSVGTFTLNPAINNQEAYQLNTPVYNEYFIVENRQRIGFDSYLPGEGMLIYHVDLNYPGWLSGEINVDPNHQGFDIEEADNIRDTITLSGDPFPGSANVNRFDSLSIPASTTWNGNSSDVSLQNITQIGDVITFDVQNTTFSNIPDDWYVDETAYTQLGTITATVNVDGKYATSGYVSAFVDEECRGIGTATYYSGTGSYVFEVITFSNSASGETLDFRYYDPVLDSVYNLYETLPFTSDIIAGSLEDPFVLHTPVHFTKEFTPGWNWFSLNVNMADMSPGALFNTCNSDGNYLENQTVSTSYNPTSGWFGSLLELNNRDLYKVKLGTSCGVDVMGAPALPEALSRNLDADWNWIAYTPKETMTTSDALASLTPTHLDYIKNQTQSATYYSGYGWFGTLLQMHPGDGYMVWMANSDVLTFPETAASGKKSLTQTGYANQSPWTVLPSDYQYNGQVDATVVLEGAEVTTGYVGAFVGDECRGVIEGKLFPPSGKVVFSFLVYSNENSGEQLSFRYYDDAADTVYQITETKEFVSDMFADATNPFVLHAKSNRAPVVAAPLEMVSLEEGFGSTLIDLDTVFSDPDNDVLTYTAITQDASVVDVSVNGSLLTINEGTPGNTELTIMASDSEFNVTDIANIVVADVNFGPDADCSMFSDTLFVEGAGGITIDGICEAFADPDGDEMTFSASSNNEDIVSVGLDGCALALSDVGTGTATVTLCAGDGEFQACCSFEVTVIEENVIQIFQEDQQFSEGDSVKSCSEAVTIILNVHSDIPWTLASSGDWFTAEKISDLEFEIVFMENTTGSNRSGTIAVRDTQEHVVNLVVFQQETCLSDAVFADPAEGYRIYPNPVRDLVVFELTEPVMMGHSIRLLLYGAGGKLLQDITDISSFYRKVEVDMSAYQAGTYYIVVEHGGKTRKSFLMVKYQ